MMDWAEGVQFVYKFDNGYGASVVCHEGSYGGRDHGGLWEVAVLDRKGELCYATPITSDVIGYLTMREVADLLDRIAALHDAPMLGTPIPNMPH
jgi:hypothetical protein